jgi:hypothetical protein
MRETNPQDRIKLLVFMFRVKAQNELGSRHEGPLASSLAELSACLARSSDIGELVSCLTANSFLCKHSLNFGNAFFCCHPQRQEIAARTAIGTPA